MPPVSTFRSFSRSCLALAISQAIIAPAHSANFVVNRSDDVVASDGSLSLREAIICARIGSVCTGALILARTGLLDGKKATTHWAYAQKLATVSDDIDVDTKAIFIRNNNIYTSAGVTSGMDMALAMVEEDWGSEASLAVAQELVLYLKRPGGQSQFSRYLNSQQPANNKLKELQLWILENLDKDLNVNFLADRTGMSPDLSPDTLKRKSVCHRLDMLKKFVSSKRDDIWRKAIWTSKQ